MLFNPYTAKLDNLIFQSFQVLFHYHDQQLQMGKNYSYLFNLRFANLDV